MVVSIIDNKTGKTLIRYQNILAINSVETPENSAIIKFTLWVNNYHDRLYVTLDPKKEWISIA